MKLVLAFAFVLFPLLMVPNAQAEGLASISVGGSLESVTNSSVDSSTESALVIGADPELVAWMEANLGDASGTRAPASETQESASEMPVENSKKTPDQGRVETSLQELYRDAAIEESLGQTQSSRANLIKIVDLGPRSSKYVDMARAKLCRYESRFCDTSAIEPAESKSLKADQQGRLVEIRKFLSEVDGVDVSFVSGRFIIDGECATARDLDRVKFVVGLYPKDEVMSLARLSPIFLGKMAQAVANDINNPDITARVVNGTLLLEGSVLDMTERDRAGAIAEVYAHALPKPIERRYGVLNLLMLKAAPPRMPASQRK